MDSYTTEIVSGEAEALCSVGMAQAGLSGGAKYSDKQVGGKTCSISI